MGERDKGVNTTRHRHLRLIQFDRPSFPQVTETPFDFKERREELILDFLTSGIAKEPVDDLDSKAQNLNRLFAVWKEADPNDYIRRSVNYSDLERTSLNLLLIAQKAKFDAEDPLDLELADGLLTDYFRVARIVRTAHKLAQLQTASSF